MHPTNKELDIPAVGKPLPVNEVKTLTDEQRDEIATLTHSDLDDGLYLAYLDDMGASDFSNFDEAYSGQFQSDEDFAMDMAEQVGDVPKDLHWPFTCIDWEKAGSELMYDYTEINGHYFRNL